MSVFTDKIAISSFTYFRLKLKGVHGILKKLLKYLHYEFTKLYAIHISQRNPVQNGSQKRALQYFLWLDSELEKMCSNFTQKK